MKILHDLAYKNDPSGSYRQDQADYRPAWRTDIAEGMIRREAKVFV
jgi:hypothetical protein